MGRLKKDTRIDVLKVIILSTLLSEAIDDVKGTILYKHEVKKVGNRFQKMLEPYVKQLDFVYNENPMLATNLQNELDALVSKLAKKNLVDFTMINQIHEVYSKKPEDWQNLFEIHLKELNE